MEQDKHQSDPLRPENLTARAFQLLRDEINRGAVLPPHCAADSEAAWAVRDLYAALDRAEAICMKSAKRRKTKAEFAASVEAVMDAQRKPVSGTIYRVTKGGGRLRYQPLTVEDVKIRAAVHARNSIPFERLHVGYVTLSDLGEVERRIDETTRAPILKMPDNRHVTFGWSALVEAACAAWREANV